MASLDAASTQIRISVAWADGAAAHEIQIDVASGMSIAQLRESNVFQAAVPAPVRTQAAGIGVWGRIRPASYVLRPQDRVEIYQPLKVDPKEQRRRRAR